MKQKTLIISLISFMSLAGMSQEVVTSSGGFYEATDAQLSWTFGELMTETYETATVHLTQGEQQTRMQVASIADNELSEVTIYPNPFIDFFMINSDGIPYNYVIHSTTGQEIQIGKIAASETKIDLSAIATGIYYIRIYSDSKEKTFKLIKH
jgi:hypothetical protein